MISHTERFYLLFTRSLQYLVCLSLPPSLFHHSLFSCHLWTRTSPARALIPSLPCCSFDSLPVSAQPSLLFYSLPVFFSCPTLYLSLVSIFTLSKPIYSYLHRLFVHIAHFCHFHPLCFDAAVIYILIRPRLSFGVCCCLWNAQFRSEEFAFLPHINYYVQSESVCDCTEWV